MSEIIKKEFRRQHFRISDTDIPIGAEIYFSKNKDLIAVIISDSKVKFDGQTLSFSAAAKQALNLCGQNWPTIQGPKYWLYKNRPLIDYLNY